MQLVPANQDSHLILGGARSGKSTYAEKLVTGYPPPHIYVATAQALDDEMAQRIESHRQRRGRAWETVESPFDLVSTLHRLQGHSNAVLVDCLTLWLSNLLLGTPRKPLEGAVTELAAFIEVVDYPLFLVSNDVGGGIVPDNPMARRFRDLAGFANQKVAAACTAVTMTVAGIPLRLK